ncbi:unnamed protein product [Rotaria sp. Silwood1]|nr:unnamed protein product [Rotaria sp. Silwood1]
MYSEMDMMGVYFFTILIILTPTINFVDGSHFRGGIVSWRAWNTNPSGTTASILIHQRFSWRRNYWGAANNCTDLTIAQQGLVGSGTGSSTCVGGGNCASLSPINADLNKTDYYAVALQIEDYYTSTSPTPMSSVPIQFLFYGTIAPLGCSTPPSIIGVRPNLACIGTPIGRTFFILAH